ncbi:kinase-like domain-containing protein [Rhizophagus irregularis DAOM 181602=DAOM 197198]|nr:kinase-like domain-containing protein [Rhizophagus irregularis DAOM 181602=DAOM 197198]
MITHAQTWNRSISEVLRENHNYTKAADIYSFVIIMWEFTSGISAPAFNDRSHDFILSLDICKGSRPKIIESTLPVYEMLPNKRPTVDVLFLVGMIIIQNMALLIEFSYITNFI